MPLCFMKKVQEYVAYRLEPSEEDNHFEIGKYFESVEEAADFFGVLPNSLRQTAIDRHTIRGNKSVTWKVFHGDITIIDVESELERRL